jgi:hypothetical protein
MPLVPTMTKSTSLLRGQTRGRSELHPMYVSDDTSRPARPMSNIPVPVVLLFADDLGSQRTPRLAHQHCIEHLQGPPIEG